MKKKIKDLTIEEIIKICTFSDCKDCKLCFGRSYQTISNVCIFKDYRDPFTWDMLGNHSEELEQEIVVE